MNDPMLYSAGLPALGSGPAGRVELVRVPAASPREERIAAAGRIAARAVDPWLDRGGEVVPGEDVARYLEAVERMLRQHRWDPQADGGDEDALEELRDADSVGELLAAIIVLLRHPVRRRAHRRPSPLSLIGAIDEVSDGRRRPGAVVAERALAMVLRGPSGAYMADVGAWERRPGRTWSEVCELLVTGAEFARRHGPDGGVW